MMIPWGEFLDGTTTELCGEMAAGGLNQAYVEGSPDYCRYFGTYILTWKVNGRVTGAEDDNCDKINIHFQFQSDQWDTIKYGRLRRGAPRTFVIQTDRDWATTGITFDEPGYAEGHAAYPEQFPLPIPTYTISPGCPEDFPSVDEAPIILRCQAETDCPFNMTDLCSYVPPIDCYVAGTLYVGECLHPCPISTQRTPGVSWAYDTETDEIVLHFGSVYVGASYSASWADRWRINCQNSRESWETYHPGETYPWDTDYAVVDPIRVAFDDGNWINSGPWIFPGPYDFDCFARTYPDYTVSLAGDCPIGPDPEDPPNGQKHCYKKSLCLQIRMNKDETDPDAPTFEAYTQCTVSWDKTLKKYFYEYCVGPDGRPFKVRVTVWEDPTAVISGYPSYYRAWKILIEIVDFTTEDVIESSETVVMLNCLKDWSYSETFTINDESVEVYIGTKCPKLTIVPPPDCDPLCWPECVLCPTPLSMSLVVTQDPSCCLHGSYGLTYDAGNNWFTLTSAPVGGPSGVCGKITAFKMTCSDSTHVTLQITYEDVNGSTISSTTTVSANCTGGDFETDTVTVLSGLFAPGLCEGGIGLGAKFRVVGI